MAVMHEDSLLEESAPVLEMPEKVPLHEIDCMINGCNLGADSVEVTIDEDWLLEALWEAEEVDKAETVTMDVVPSTS